ncbi:Putative YbiA-like superfamily protein [Colletotrichum destructivum]|uniref:YbiA-like superfamily protein n=1 Tax=Colletotrichum destructivum TaxID=34406 RepID=A0AAX4IMP9_9PEZI|nr:Putative YbiA-like superfamily protein [Colletotrichum destructivum]
MLLMRADSSSTAASPAPTYNHAESSNRLSKSASEMNRPASSTIISIMETSPIYFWRETGPEGYLSQWWTRDPFTIAATASSPPITFRTAEHYMMHGKALLFADADAALAILRADHPRKVKALGRRVRGFDGERWDAERERVVREGNLLKFRAAPQLRERLLATGSRELVEASPTDRIWGIGFAPDKAPASDRACWGLNLLGKVLMEVREALRKEEQQQHGGEKKKKGSEEKEEQLEVEEKQIQSRTKRRRTRSQDEEEMRDEDTTSKSRRVKKREDGEEDGEKDGEVDGEEDGEKDREEDKRGEFRG